MTTPAEYKKETAQNLLAVQKVQPLLEQLTMELALTRPTRPVPALIERLEHMDLPVRPSQRVVVTAIGAPLGPQALHSARGTVLRLTPTEVIDQAARGGRSEKGYADVHVPVELQEEVVQSLETGTPIPTEVLSQLFQNRVEQEEEARSLPPSEKLIVLIEGYPRTISQAIGLEESFGRVNFSILAYAGDTAEAIPEERETVWEDYDAPTAAVEEYWKAKRALDVIDASSESVLLEQLQVLLDSC